MNQLRNEGFEILPGVLGEDEIRELRDEVEQVCADKNRAGHRGICEQSDRFRQLALDLGSKFTCGLSCVRSIFFDKTPHRNWPVAWHRDLTIAVAEKMDVEGYGPWSVKDGIVHVQPPLKVLQAMITLRLHLDNTTDGNGSLQVIPGSHLPGFTTSKTINSEKVFCECLAGDVLAMSPLILHSSARSVNPVRRRVLHFEYADLSTLAEELSWYECS